MNNALLLYRQWTFDPAFRLSVLKGAPDADLVSALVAEPPATEAQKMVSAVPSLPVVREAPEALEDDIGFLIELGNAYFRLQRNAREIKAKSPDSTETNRILRSVENMDNLLRDRGIECHDLEGKPYDDGRLDFEPLGTEPLIGNGGRPTIGRCERPVIRKDGKLIQKGRGIVLRPA